MESFGKEVRNTLKSRTLSRFTSTAPCRGKYALTDLKARASDPKVRFWRQMNVAKCFQKKRKMLTKKNSILPNDHGVFQINRFWKTGCKSIVARRR